MPYLICETPEQLTIALEVVSRYPSSVDWRAETPKHAVLNALPFLHMRVADAEKTGRRITGLFPRHVWRYVPSDRETEVVLESVTDGISLPAEYRDDSRRALHWSNEKPGMVAYAPDEVSLGSRNYRRTTLGKYLARYCGHVAERERYALAERLVAEWTDSATLKITTDANEIGMIYHNLKCGSCMYAPSRWTPRNHPARVYGDSDLAVAYLGTVESPTARAVVWPDRKRYHTLYASGTTDVLKAALRAAGYVYGTFEGARVRALSRSNGTYWMPYIDGAEYADLRGEYWRLGDGNVSVRETCGYVHDQPQYSRCEHCGDEYRPQGEDSGYCDDCEHRRFHCGHCDEERFSRRYSVYCVTLGRSLIVCRDCHEEHYTYVCEALAHRYVWHDGFMHPLQTEDSGVCGTEFSLDEFSRTEVLNRRARGVAELCRACANEHDRCHCGEYVRHGQTCTCGAVPRCQQTMLLPFDVVTP